MSIILEHRIYDEGVDLTRTSLADIVSNRRIASLCIW